jgi:hypothetical protein
MLPSQFAQKPIARDHRVRHAHRRRKPPRSTPALNTSPIIRISKTHRIVKIKNQSNRKTTQNPKLKPRQELPLQYHNIISRCSRKL